MDSKRGKPQSSGGTSGDSSPASPSGSPAQPSSAAPPPVPVPLPGGNAFANDGSFMEMFKKKMEEEERRKKEKTGGDARGAAAEHGQSPVEKKAPPVTSFVGKRRGGVFLKTGIVAKKQKQDSEAEPGRSDAWSKYMAEVKKYKAHQCGDDDKTRPLVK